MLEALLSHFRSYGMDDLEFIIVNSKLSHSQEKLPELERRVSFKVYQETDEDEVWSVIEGGKDDMYVYDRCGRLTYYIPFPLSILNESPLVSNAILATYFRSPCGNKCEENKTLEIEDVVKNMERDFEVTNTTEQDYNSTSFVTEGAMYTDETIHESTNESYISNDLFEVIDPENSEIDVLNSNNTINYTDSDYSTNDNSSFLNITKDPRVDKANTFFDSIYRLFFNKGSDTDAIVETTTSNTTSNETYAHDHGHQNITNITSNEITSHHLHHHMNHDHHKQGHGENGGNAKKNSDRCLEADYEVCKSWSKNRLLHAQRCCSEMHAHSEMKNQKSCAFFGKKRCKKIQSILKCCIKTVYAEPTIVTTTEESIMPSVGEQEKATELPDLVCCKPTDEGKLCRVPNSKVCEEDEKLEQSPSVRL